ncbi:hypothetical protein VIGAN_07139600, partial [Vigna angularis var. angularis]
SAAPPLRSPFTVPFSLFLFFSLAQISFSQFLFFFSLLLCHHSVAPPLRRHHSVAPPSPHLLQRLRKPWLPPTPQPQPVTPPTLQPQPVTPPTPQPQPHHQSPPNRTRSHSTSGRDLRSSVVRGPPGATKRWIGVMLP